MKITNIDKYVKWARKNLFTTPVPGTGLALMNKQGDVITPIDNTHLKLVKHNDIEDAIWEDIETILIPHTHSNESN